MYLYGNAIWFPVEFLEQHASSLVASLDKKSRVSNADAHRVAYLHQQDAALPNQAQLLYAQTSLWMVRIESTLTGGTSSAVELKARIGLLIQGLVHAHSIANYLKSSLNLHVFLGVPLTRSHVRHLCKLIEILKSIEFTYHKRTQLMADSLAHAIQHLSLNLMAVIAPIRARLSAEQKYSDKHLDILASLSLIIDLLNGPAGPVRRDAIQLALAVVSNMKIFREGIQCNAACYQRCACSQCVCVCVCLSVCRVCLR